MAPNSNEAYSARLISIAQIRSAIPGSAPIINFDSPGDRRVVTDAHWTLLVKRGCDVALAALLLLALAPLFAILAILVWSQRDGGKVFYGQRRIGRFGDEFRCLKFRSMCPDADLKLRSLLEADAESRLEWDSTQKLRNDPRITRLGRFLRSTSLDELPQLLNVVRGDMSLVGPRPITRAEIDGPYVKFNGRTEYLAVRPGITGLWQVSGRSQTAYEDRVALDKSYVRNFSLRADGFILVKTVRVVLLRRGAH